MSRTLLSTAIAVTALLACTAARGVTIYQDTLMRAVETPIGGQAVQTGTGTWSCAWSNQVMTSTGLVSPESWNYDADGTPVISLPVSITAGNIYTLQIDAKNTSLRYFNCLGFCTSVPTNALSMQDQSVGRFWVDLNVDSAGALAHAAGNYGPGVLVRENVSQWNTYTIVLDTNPTLWTGTLSVDGSTPVVIPDFEARHDVGITGIMMGKLYNGAEYRNFSFSDNTAPALVAGDANGDGKVDDNDLNALLSNWNTGIAWNQGNFKGTGFTDDNDLNTLLSHWSGSGAAVPEPVTMSLLALGGMALLRRRK